MIHFPVAVFMPKQNAKSLEALLAPYGKTIAVAPFSHRTPENNLTGNSDTPSTINPNPKWDSWSVGGKWADTLLLKGSRGIKNGVSAARVSDIDFAAMQRRDGTVFCTSDVITPDGKWHSAEDRSRLGFLFGEASSNWLWTRSYHARFIKQAIKRRWRLVIVDCYI